MAALRDLRIGGLSAIDLVGTLLGAMVLTGWFAAMTWANVGVAFVALWGVGVGVHWAVGADSPLLRLNVERGVGHDVPQYGQQTFYFRGARPCKSL